MGRKNAANFVGGGKMSSSDAKSKSALGFLSVINDPDDGLFGGYLVLNLAGRPLEFHCTAPVKPNRAQQILYGPTLEPYLYGEQIGQALLAKAKLEPLAVCTDQEPVLAVREFTKAPVALVLPSETVPAGDGSAKADAKIWRIDAPHASGAAIHAFQLGRNRLGVPEAAASDEKILVERLTEAAAAFDLAEPFQRIREAIEEARRGG
jgi:hypothetical protein